MFSPALLAAGCLAAFMLGGCGRRGGLEAPPDPAVEAARAANPDAKPRKPHRSPIKPPKTPFILDPLV